MKKIDVGERVVLIKEINEPSHGIFRNIGTVAYVLDVSIDPLMPSGYSALLEDRGTQYIVDKSTIMHMDDYIELSNYIVSDFVDKLRGVK